LQSRSAIRAPHSAESSFEDVSISFPPNGRQGTRARFVPSFMVAHQAANGDGRQQVVTLNHVKSFAVLCRLANHHKSSPQPERNTHANGRLFLIVDDSAAGRCDILAVRTLAMIPSIESSAEAACNCLKPYKMILVFSETYARDHRWRRPRENRSRYPILPIAPHDRYSDAAKAAPQI